MIINEKTGSFVIELIEMVDLSSVKTSAGEMEKKTGKWGKRPFDWFTFPLSHFNSPSPLMGFSSSQTGKNIYGEAVACTCVGAAMNEEREGHQEGFRTVTPETSLFFFRISSISSAENNLPLPTPGQEGATSCSHTSLFMFSGQNGQVRHCQGREA